MTWEIISGLIVVCGFIISVAKIVHNNTQALTEVRCSVDKLNGMLEDTETSIKDINKELAVHETRITVIENELK